VFLASGQEVSAERGSRPIRRPEEPGRLAQASSTPLLHFTARAWEMFSFVPRMAWQARASISARFSFPYLRKCDGT